MKYRTMYDFLLKVWLVMKIETLVQYEEVFTGNTRIFKISMIKTL